VGTAGNVSARAVGSDGFWVTPSAVPYDVMTPASIVRVDVAGMPLAISAGRRGRPSSDTPTHAAIYAARPDAGGIVHSHSPHATAFAAVGRAIPPLLLEAAGYLGGDVPVAPYVAPASPDLAATATRALAGRLAVLLPNHGVLAVGKTVEAALTAAIMVEQSARVAWLAVQLGEPHPVPASDIELMHRFLHQKYGQK
jgi:ribulose-5-phosphate 4-epimerase/fuculose-1-phosphate aldolase